MLIWCRYINLHSKFDSHSFAMAKLCQQFSEQPKIEGARWVKWTQVLNASLIILIVNKKYHVRSETSKKRTIKCGDRYRRLLFGQKYSTV